MLEHEGIMDFNGHFSAHLPSGRGLMINAADSVRSRIGARDFIDVDFDGRPFVDDRTPPMEFHLHSQIHLRRPDMHANVHTHPHCSTVLATLGKTWQPVTMQATVLGPAQVLKKTASMNSVTLDLEMAESLDGAKTVLMQRHDAETVAASVSDAFGLAIYLEENAYRQYMAPQIGTPQALSEAEYAVIDRNLSPPVLLQKSGRTTSAKTFQWVCEPVLTRSGQTLHP